MDTELIKNFIDNRNVSGRFWKLCRLIFSITNHLYWQRSKNETSWTAKREEEKIEDKWLVRRYNANTDGLVQELEAMLRGEK